MSVSDPQSRGMTPQECRRLFRRVLAAWASDLLSLRRDGLDVPGQRNGRGPWGATAQRSPVGPGNAAESRRAEELRRRAA